MSVTKTLRQSDILAQHGLQWYLSMHSAGKLKAIDNASDGSLLFSRDAVQKLVRAYGDAPPMQVTKSYGSTERIPRPGTAAKPDDEEEIDLDDTDGIDDEHDADAQEDELDEDLVETKRRKRRRAAARKRIEEEQDEGKKLLETFVVKCNQVRSLFKKVQATTKHPTMAPGHPQHVRRGEDGRWYITDSGNRVIGRPYRTQAAAHQALEQAIREIAGSVRPSGQDTDVAAKHLKGKFNREARQLRQMAQKKGLLP